ncbi:MAG: glycosyltransferase family 2 protein [Oscillospiraceae bacterium]|nr:glycosyltransferase family 2 protein [Oscillospiraceae bacterium]
MYALILVDYNSLDSTIAYIERYQKAIQKSASSHILIVETGDAKDAVERLTQTYGAPETIQLKGITQPLYCFQWEDYQIVYCPAGENLGYAKGNNLGTAIARELWADPYYIISNNDLEFREPMDLQIADDLFAQNPKIAVIGPQVITPAGKQQSPHKWISAYRRLIVFIWLCALDRFLKPQQYQKLRAKYCEDLCFDAPTGPCAWVSGCFFLLRADAFHAADMFDPHTFLYAEEPILSRRLEAAGYQVWFCRELAVTHVHGQTTKNAFSRLRIMKLDFQSIWYYYKTYTNTPAIVLLLAKWNFALYCFAHRCFNLFKETSR